MTKTGLHHTDKYTSGAQVLVKLASLTYIKRINLLLGAVKRYHNARIFSTIIYASYYNIIFKAMVRFYVFIRIIYIFDNTMKQKYIYFSYSLILIPYNKSRNQCRLKPIRNELIM